MTDSSVGRSEQSISDFKLLRTLSSGGVGQVWLARKKRTGDFFALKAMRKVRAGLEALSQSISCSSRESLCYWLISTALAETRLAALSPGPNPRAQDPRERMR